MGSIEARLDAGIDHCVLVVSVRQEESRLS